MIQIIPAIDIIEGKCVRLKKGDYNQKTIYNENPLEIAKEFEDAGIKRLHLVDLDGAKAKHVVNLKVLENIASHTNLEIDFGGGIKSDLDIENVFNYGATFATIGSVAITQPGLLLDWITKYSGEKIILCADIKDGFIAITGWKDITKVKINEFIADYSLKGITTILCTDISKDGMLMGASINLYEKLNSDFPKINFIASGGIFSINEIDRLNNMNVFGAIIGKAYYEGRIKLNELSKYL